MLKKIGQFLGLGKNGGLLNSVADVVDRFVDTPAEKKAFFREIYEMEIREKNHARELYGRDSSMQKIYAATFLMAYLALTGWLVAAIISNAIEDINQFETGLIGSIWGAMTAKVNTITDFFFGSSENRKGKKDT